MLTLQLTQVDSNTHGKTVKYTVCINTSTVMQTPLIPTFNKVKSVYNVEP